MNTTNSMTQLIMPTSRPTLKQVAEAILLICENNAEYFTPTILRKQISINFYNVFPSTLSAQIQPHLRSLVASKMIEIVSNGQQHNRPYRIINRVNLIEIAKGNNDSLFCKNSSENVVGQYDDAKAKDTIPTDVENNKMVEMNQRLITLESKVKLLLDKLDAIGDILRS